MRALVLVVMAACGSARTRSEPVGNRAAPPPRPACVESQLATIAKHLQARWNTTEVSIVRCTPGLFPTAGYFLEVEDGDTARIGVLGTDGTTELVPFESRGQLMVATSIVECATVDLDGDGVDEIVETWRKSAHGRMGSDNWLEIRRVVDTHFTTIRGPHTSVFHPELGGCTGEVRLAGHTLVITVENLPGIPPSDCLSAGTHTFALDKDAVIEIDAARLTHR